MSPLGVLLSRGSHTESCYSWGFVLPPRKVSPFSRGSSNKVDPPVSSETIQAPAGSNPLTVAVPLSVPPPLLSARGRPTRYGMRMLLDVLGRINYEGILYKFDSPGEGPTPERIALNAQWQAATLAIRAEALRVAPVFHALPMGRKLQVIEWGNNMTAKTTLLLSRGAAGLAEFEAARLAEEATWARIHAKDYSTED